MGKVKPQQAPVKAAALTSFFVTNDVISSYYNLPAGFLPKDKNGNDICKDLGYAGCLVAQVSVWESVYATSDNTCTPNPTESEHYYLLEKCTTMAHTSTCYPGSLSENAPPVPSAPGNLEGEGKDFSISKSFESVICLK